MTVIIGIDPGLSGAIATIKDGRLIGVDDMPVLRLSRNGKQKGEIDAIEFGRILAAINEAAIDVVAYVERVGAMPGQGAASIFSFGVSAGVIKGALGALKIPIEYVTPQSWKKFHKITTGSGKDASLARAKGLFPSSAELFAMAKDDGRAEATLIAVYGYHAIKGNG